MPAVGDVFKQITEAYSVLSNSKARRRYDQARHGSRLGSPINRVPFATADGSPLILGQRVAGQDTRSSVFRVAGRSDLVAKIYHDHEINANRRAKIMAMVASKPRQRTAQDRRSGKTVPALAWPEDAVLRAGRVCGFTMPAIDMNQSVEIRRIENALARETRTWTSRLDLRHRAIIALNLALIVRQAHESGIVIGDLSDHRIVVSPSLVVCLRDCDDMQVRDAAGRYHTCEVSQPGFVPPELADVDLKTTIRQPSSDLYCLALHVHSLIAEGSLTPELGELSVRASGKGKADPGLRPTTDQWIKSLARYLAELKQDGSRAGPRAAAGPARSSPQGQTQAGGKMGATWG